MLLNVLYVSQVILLILFTNGPNVILTPIALNSSFFSYVLAFLGIELLLLDLFLFLEGIEVLLELFKFGILHPVFNVEGKRQKGEGVLSQLTIKLGHIKEQGLFVTQMEVIFHSVVYS